MSEFDEIRPYNDKEVSGVLERLLNDNEFIDSIIKFKCNKLVGFFAFALRGVVRSRLVKKTQHIETVAGFQAEIEPYLVKALDDTITELSVSGLESLNKNSSYLFISNHRDIVMDPALVNLVIFNAGFSTLRIAIGDNLLTKPFASDLMRLNKSFIVKRSAKSPREKFKAAKILSNYINHSVLQDGENVWIAQREGRAKDGFDKTNSAIISMLSLSKPKPQPLGEFISEARIVPVSISYEYDPCDAEKARELYLKDKDGAYEKAEHEDVKSIAKGITGFKGRVNVCFGEPLSGDFADSEAVTKELDHQVHINYQLHPSNCIAYEMLEGHAPKVCVGESQVLFTEHEWNAERRLFAQRLASINELHRQVFLASYANPVKSTLSEVEL